MRRPAALVGTWLVATALATLVVWLGVRVVDGEVTSRRPAALAQAAPGDVIAGDAPTSSTTSTLDLGATGSSTTTAPPTTNPTTAKATTTTRVASDVVIRDYVTQGGFARIRYSSAGVDVISAAPNPGYEVEVSDTPDQPLEVRVEFKSDAHDSRIDASWNGGPADKVTESDHGDDGGGASTGGT